MPPVHDLTGERFGRLMVIDASEKVGGKTAWLCSCDCGEMTIALSTNLVTGNTRSCGCLGRESRGSANRTHGLTGTRLHRIWASMRGRCNIKSHTSYPNYGARGIRTCEEWDDFELFKSWSLANRYREHLSIDRIDNDGDYCPGNCQWVTRSVQSRNTRRNHRLTFRGQTRTLAGWSEKTGIESSTIRQRLNAGWTVGRALTEPVNHT